MAKWHRKSAIVDAFHLSQELSFEDLTQGLADFISEASGDFGVSFQSGQIRLRSKRGDLTPVVGDWLVILGGQLSVMTNDDFVQQHEYVG